MTRKQNRTDQQLSVCGCAHTCVCVCCMRQTERKGVAHIKNGCVCVCGMCYEETDRNERTFEWYREGGKESVYICACVWIQVI